MAMLLSILDWDESFFYLLNKEWTNSFFDYVLPIWRDKMFWLPLYFFIVSFLVLNFKKKGYYLILALLITVGAADIISSEVIKKNVQRLRPCNDPEMLDERTLIRCGRGYSFTSNHAANHFAISMFLIFTLGRRYKRVLGPALFWAVSVAYAQVYVGVHYPLDVLFGGLLGTMIAYIFSQLFQRSPWAIN